MLQETKPAPGARVPRYAYIDALRGYAILGVIGVHASQLFPSLERPLRVVADQGARGVQLFFTVSALTLMMSWQNRADGVLPFWTRRVFRVGPMFWLALAYYLILVGWFNVHLHYWAPAELSWRNVLATAALLHGLHPDTIDSVVPGGWSIADEMEFYALFPLLAATIRSWRAAGFALIMSTGLVLVPAAFSRCSRPRARAFWRPSESFFRSNCLSSWSASWFFTCCANSPDGCHMGLFAPVFVAHSCS